MANIDLSKHSKHINVLNEKFNFLTVIGFSGKSYNGTTLCLCVCDCGAEKIVSISKLKLGEIKSCGCRGIGYEKHGMKKSPEYWAWRSMKKRCKNQNTNGYDNYGGRGITVCRNWENSFVNFLKDMGEKPSSKHSLDRIDNNKGYFKENCRWTDKITQINNRRVTVMVNDGEEILPMQIMAKKHNISYHKIVYRIRKNFSENQIIDFIKVNSHNLVKY